MANSQVPYEASEQLVNERRAHWNGDSNSCNLALYTDGGYTFSPTDTLSDLEAIEASFDGYARFQLTSWSAAGGPDGSGRFVTVETLRAFICTGLTGLPVTIYGFFVCDTNTSKLLWVQAAAVPVVIATIGDYYAVIAKYTQKSEF